MSTKCIPCAKNMFGIFFLMYMRTLSCVVGRSEKVLSLILFKIELREPSLESSDLNSDFFH